jgi:mono/diheme cytochrome c family protein
VVARLTLVATVAVVVIAAVVGGLRLTRSGPDGRAVFASSCAACHTLRGGSSPGGDLTQNRLTAAEIASFARVMPVHPRLSDAEIRAVAAYVAARNDA